MLNTSHISETKKLNTQLKLENCHYKSHHSTNFNIYFVKLDYLWKFLNIQQNIAVFLSVCITLILISTQVSFSFFSRELILSLY